MSRAHDKVRSSCKQPFFFVYDFFPSQEKPFELSVYDEAMAIASTSQCISEFAPHSKVLDPYTSICLDLTVVEFDGEMLHNEHSCSSMSHSASSSSLDSQDVSI